MKASLTDKLLQIQDRFEELGALLSDSEVIGQQEKFRAFSKEYAELEPVVLSHTQYLQACTDLSDSLSLAEDSDPDIREMAAEEAKALEQSIRELGHELEILLLPNDPNDQTASAEKPVRSSPSSRERNFAVHSNVAPSRYPGCGR